jgi:hypothetical protein
MDNSKPSNRMFIWIILLLASTIPPATTPLDQWTFFTLLSLLAAVGTVVLLMIDFIKWVKSKKGG